MSVKLQTLEETRGRQAAAYEEIRAPFVGKEAEIPADVDERLLRCFEDMQRTERDIAVELSNINAEQAKREQASNGGSRFVNPHGTSMKAARKVSSFDTLLRSGCSPDFARSEKYLKMLNEENELVGRSTVQFDDLAKGGFFATGPGTMDGVIQAIDNELNFQTLCEVLHNIPLAGLGMMELTTDVLDATWGAELGAYTESSPRTGKRALKPNFHRVLVKAGASMLEAAAFDLESYIYKRIGYKMGVAAENGFMTGTGIDQPLGIFTAATAGISTSRDRATATANTFKPDDLWAAFFDLKTAHSNKATWVFSRTVMAEIRKMKDTTGQYIWNPTGNIGDALITGSPATVCGRPYMMSEYAPAYSTTTGTYVAVLGNFRAGYVVGWAEDMRILRAGELYAATDEVGYFARAAMDAQPVLEEAFARVKIG